jgi:predicted helicase
MSLRQILESYRNNSFSQRDRGDKFERLIQCYLLTDPQYASVFDKIWLWETFPHREQLSLIDVGIDLVGKTIEGDYWAIQCKFYSDSAYIDKPSVDSFLATSSRTFQDESGNLKRFNNRLWVATTNRWNQNARNAIQNQNPPVTLIKLSDLEKAPVNWELLDQGIHGKTARSTDRSLMAHQYEALKLINEHFKIHDRGKLIMACGTGKTYTALKIAEHETQDNGLVLFLVPSIALLGQTLREWSSFAKEPIHPICICSDSKITKKRTQNDDTGGTIVEDLAWPASTDTEIILQQFWRRKNNPNKGLTVVFSTYQSIEVISEVQASLQEEMPEFSVFDIIICDEAHRTTGVTLSGEDDSAFVRVHNNSFIQSKKRLYMTATPRIFSSDSISKAAQANATLCSMDDESLYGKEVFRIGFGRAVEEGLLTDYKVLILTLNDFDIPLSVKKILTESDHEVNTDDASKLIGCINALSKQILGDEGILQTEDPEPMKRAVAFCQNINVSKTITETFNETADIYLDTLPDEQKRKMISVTSKHIDGSMSALDRDELLSWLKSDTDEKCKILTNVRVLSEGVDVPSLDSVMFLSARNSQVDVVQSVGRVMRRAPGKKYGYIIIPVVVPTYIDAKTALDDNERYKVVWTVLNALRAHDDRFNATVNKIELNRKKPSNILVGRPQYSFDETGNPIAAEPNSTYDAANELSRQISIQFEELQNVVFARMVDKVGDRRYWEQWAQNVAGIAQRQITRIQNLIQSKPQHKLVFDKFLSSLQANINPSIQFEKAVEMLSQHLITKPVFEALFQGYAFSKLNPVSVAMENMISILEENAIDDETKQLEGFYESVKKRAEGIDNAEGKQKIIIELYDKFFKTAFPKMVEQLGIVYTPTEVVDFIIHSVNDILKKEFNKSLTQEGVKILDPFTGTGTFITRLFQSGLIHPNDLERKYKSEIFANEMVLLAYYIATINIENAYHDATPDPNDGIGKDKYEPFEGIVLTDTFQLGEDDGSNTLFADMFPQNFERLEKQKQSGLTVIFGNPPYSVGQNSVNDNAQNQHYPILSKRIENTYVKESNANLKNSLYDSYIKAFRWSSDRLDKNGGVICFISNGAWIDGNAASGFRKSIEKEFTSIYVFNLRGNQRTTGELSRKEGGKIFGSGSRTPISITLLVKNPLVNNEKSKIYYHDIGDYLTQNEKLNIVKGFGSMFNDSMNWKELKPNEHGDWISQRNELFSTLISIEKEIKSNGKENSFFNLNSCGVATSRDSWVYNFSMNHLRSNMSDSIIYYNEQQNKFQLEKLTGIEIEDFITRDATKIVWTDTVIRDANKGIEYKLKDEDFVIGMYRPFMKQKFYFNKQFNHRTYQQKKIFPNQNLQNLVICISGLGASKGFSCLISDKPTNNHFIDTSQCFPLYIYEENNISQRGLFDSESKSDFIKRDGTSDFILKRAQNQYGAKNITKEDIFYYVYGFLHSPEYRETFSNDLKKMLPRLPLVDDVRDFWSLSKSGRELAQLHINYEQVPRYDGVKVVGEDSGFFKVEKMKFPNKGQKDIIIFNPRITIENIPLEAYDYVVNGKSAIEWIMERYQITTHKESQITNDPNDWCEEEGNPRYILDLLLSIINVSIQTRVIVQNLPKITF